MCGTAAAVGQCVVAEEIERYFLLPCSLACKYTTYIFLTYHKFQLATSLSSSSSSTSTHRSRRSAHALSFADFEFFALAIMNYWVSDHTRSILHLSLAHLPSALTPSSTIAQPTSEQIPAVDSIWREASSGSFMREPSASFAIDREMSSFRQGSVASVGSGVDPGRFVDLARGLWLVMQEMVEEEVGNSSGEWSSVMLPSQKILQEGLKNVYVSQREGGGAGVGQ